MPMNKEQILRLLKQHKQEIAQQFGVTKIGIFGSVARGTAKKNSDIDIVVELNKQNLLNTIGLKYNLEKFFGVSVDVVNYRESLSPLLKDRIKQDVIYV